MINANATNDSESVFKWDHYTEALDNPNYSYAVTFRPCEHKIVTLGTIRKKYGSFTLDQQKDILQNVINHCKQKGIILVDINFETTKTMHFHCFLYFNESATQYALEEHSKLLNKRYGPETYKAFDFRETFKNVDSQGHKSWHDYITKSHVHPISEWCCGI